MMTAPGKAPGLPQPSLSCLAPIAAPEILSAWVARQPKGRCAREAASKHLSDYFAFAEVLAEAKLFEAICEEGEFLVALPKPFNGGSSPAKTGNTRHDALRDIAALALGGSATAVPLSKHGRRSLAALALKSFYSLEELAGWPSAEQARCALLARIVASFGSVFQGCGEAPLKSFKFDEMSRRIYLAFAGLQRGTVLQADSALLSRALGAPADTVEALTAAIIRAALKARAPEVAGDASAFDLESFANAVRQLASHHETKPYTGRVAIAQVYDAGLSGGLPLGTLDEFKANVAEAAREGLLDLERYDITGPFDAGLKERSRLRLGRDERHFIVNQWI